MDQKKVFLAGASGAIGFPLAKLLVKNGYAVTGTTRKMEKAETLRKVGIKPVIIDVYDAEKLRKILQSESPDIVIHQLTDLPFGLPPERMKEGITRNNRMRLRGTQNLLDAMAGLSVTRFLVQSIAFMYQDGKLPHPETDRLSSKELERFETIASNGGFDATILRYGRFYGEGTGVDIVDEDCRVHISAAARATILALQKMKYGVYNVCEDRTYADNARFISETGWDPKAK